MAGRLLPVTRPQAEDTVEKAATIPPDGPQGSFFRNREAIREITNSLEQDLVLISGVGSVYPMLRSHKLLNNLHSVMGQTPLVMFYPGKYDMLTLRLFGKTGLAGGAPEDRKKKANYYRAFRLIE